MKPCAEPGCPALTERGGYCERHRASQSRWQHTQKTAARGYGAAHQRWRRAVLARDPLCVDCSKEGRVTPATEAHHIDSNPLNRLLENGMGLCRRCHNRRTHGADARERRSETGVPKEETLWTFE